MANFTVTASGGFVAPNGTPWTMRGLNAGVQDALQGFGNVLTDYPGLTAIRLNTGGNDSAADIDKVVQEYTARGVVVVIEDHSGNQDNVAWYTQMATAYKGNSHVFLEMPNEPNANNLAQIQIGLVNAIRAAGFTNPIALQPAGGYDFSAISAVTASVGTSNIYITPHIYYSGSDPNGAASYVSSDISTSLSLGLFPAIDEFGNALDGFTLDPYGNSVISSVIAANEAGKAGAVFWAMDNGNHPDGTDSAFLNTSGSQLTPVGQNIRPWLSQPTTTTGGGTTPPVTTPPVTTPPVTTTNPVLIKPGVGSFKDTAGNLYTVAANGDADENGNLMNGGTATGALELAKGIIYGQDSATGTWYTWNQSTWTQAASAPPAITVTPPVTTPPVTTPPVTTPPVTTPPVTTTNPVLIKPGVGSFKDTAGNVYTVAANGDADENGNLMNGGTATGALELAKGVIYGQDSATGTWYTWNQSTWTQAVSAPPAITVTPPVTTPPVTTPPVTTPPVTTTNPVLIKPGVGSFKDTAGNVYTVAANGDADENGNLMNGGTATGAMELAKGIIYGQDSATGTWYTWNQSTWTQAASAPPAITVTPPVTTPPVTTPPVTTPPVTTPPVTTINPVKITPGVGSFKDTAGNVYTVSTTGNADENGNLMNGGTATGAMELAKGVIYGQDSASGTWYTWNQTTWTQAASAPPAPPAVSETGNHGSLTELLSQTGSYTVGGDTFVLTAGNAASVTLGTGTSQIKFIGASSITLTGGSGQSTVTADAGTNKFVAGTGTLDVTGGGGKDAYVFHANGGLLKLEDFSIAKGDTLTVDKTLQGAMHQASDGQGGTMITFGAGATHGVDIHGLATMPTTSVHWA